MANPDAYQPEFSFGDFSTLNPADQQPGTALDNEFFNLQAVIEAVIAALADVRRSDGALPNASVTLDTLAPAVKLAIDSSTSQVSIAVSSVAGRTGDVVLTQADVAGLTAALSARPAVANVPGGYASIDSGGKIAESVLPALAITESLPVASQAAMLALTAQKGDVAIRSDLNKSFILAASPASTLANWLELRTPTDVVLSVNGQTGVVSLATVDIVGLVAALAAKADLDSAQITGTPTAPTPTSGSASGQIANKGYVDTNAGPKAVGTVSTPTTTGTAIDITGIPSTAKRVIVDLTKVSPAAQSTLMLRPLTTSGVEATGFEAQGVTWTGGGSTVSAQYTTGYGLSGADISASVKMTGRVVFQRQGATNLWVVSGSLGTDGSGGAMAHGSKTLGAALTGIRLTTVAGTASFNGGAFSVFWE